MNWKLTKINLLIIKISKHYLIRISKNSWIKIYVEIIKTFCWIKKISQNYLIKVEKQHFIKVRTPRCGCGNPIWKMSKTIDWMNCCATDWSPMTCSEQKVAMKLSAATRQTSRRTWSGIETGTPGITSPFPGALDTLTRHHWSSLSSSGRRIDLFESVVGSFSVT